MLKNGTKKVARILAQLTKYSNFAKINLEPSHELGS